MLSPGNPARQRRARHDRRESPARRAAPRRARAHPHAGAVGDRPLQLRGAGPGPAHRAAELIVGRGVAVYAGLVILLVLAYEAASGWLLWVAAHRRSALATAFLAALPAERLQGPLSHRLLDLPNLTDDHVWLGYLLLALIGVKLW